jgi:hypothetical protein
MARLLIASVSIASVWLGLVTSGARAQEREWVGVGVYADLEWRALGVAEHLSHGPGFSIGASFLDGWLRVGVAGFARPGPMNPATWEVPTADGSSYRGRDRLTLRSDGNFLGVQLALAFEVPGVPWLAISIPVTVGAAAFGFYLTGDDRRTPDGARVSEWENRLLDERDSSTALGIEAGLRLHAVLPDARWLRPYVAVHYLTAIGYDAYVTDRYDGFSGALGLELGYGL